MITFNNGSTIQPIHAASNVRSNRSKLTKIFYHCPSCNTYGLKLMSELYLIKGVWYCRECVDVLNNMNM